MKSFISKKKDKAQDIVKLSKNEIVIPNVNMAELDKRFAMAEMNNSLLKKNKNIHQTDISCSDNQSIVFTDDDDGDYDGEGADHNVNGHGSEDNNGSDDGDG